MKNRNFYLSKVSDTDLNLTFNLANEKVARKWSLNPSKIKYLGHFRWLKKKLKKKDFYFWKLMKKSKCFGLVRIEKIKKKYELSYLISQKFRGKRLGSKMINLATKRILRIKPKTKIFAKSFVKNISSNKTLLKSNFIFVKKNKNINLYVYKK